MTNGIRIAGRLQLHSSFVNRHCFSGLTQLRNALEFSYLAVLTERESVKEKEERTDWISQYYFWRSNLHDPPCDPANSLRVARNRYRRTGYLHLTCLHPAGKDRSEVGLPVPKGLRAG